MPFSPVRSAVVALATASVGFHLYLVFSGLIPNLVSRPLHLALALPWVFWVGVGGPPSRRLLSWLIGAFGIFASLYIAFNRDQLVEQYGYLEGPGQYLLGIGLILVVLEMARRAIKLALPIVAVIALSYGLLGQYLPGQFGHPGLPLGSFLGTLTIAEGGIWGPLTGVSVNVVAVFVILGAFIGAGEGGEAFMALAIRLAGRFRAGAAKVSVLSSAFFGSISGSASANVASTGAITLPVMKRLGYPPGFAAAVEAVASSGGQIMPPLMGAGAFVMMELLRISYTEVMSAALLPAILFFFAAWAGVDLFARRYGLLPMSREQIPPGRRVLRLAPFFVLPFSVLLGVLFLTGYTPQYAAAGAIFTSALLLLLDEDYRPSPGRWRRRLTAACVGAASQIATIAAIIICAGLVIGVLNQTGLGIKVTSVIIGLSGGQLWIALLLTALACLILGMEVPTTAAYVICISVAGPALQELGMAPLNAHLFVFWYALLSTITPPVCGTVFIAAGMAQTPWVPVAGQSMRLGLGLYVVPLAFVANPALIHPGQGLAAALLAFAKVGLGLWFMSRALIGGGEWWLRPLWLVLGLAVVFLAGIGG
ncbi:MAG TPA: TRAP transporter fused permease subunit [Sedimenticola thiotaurini]|uniref:TRAP transporter fused permease subunit n=1 Tax=Sedimenticola thiotaurini TaxID=1543721 RepID=A0A831RK34_9GAMM|nr:TRAP transporter fused permease subunit [Sedimenticola thiotaurini]